MRTVIVEDDLENPVEKVVLAQAIVDISKSMNRLLASGLNEKAIVCLIHDDVIGVGKNGIRAVLESLKSLSKTYCK